MDDIEELACDNIANIEEEFNPKPKKAAKKPPAPKPMSASVIKESRKFLERKKDNSNREEKLRELNRNAQYKQYFGHRISKYSKLSLKNSLDDIELQNSEIRCELNSSRSIPATKGAFKTAVTWMDKASQLFDVGINLNGLSKIVEDDDVFEAEFGEPLTQMAIDYSLFHSGPLKTLLGKMTSLIISVHMANEAGAASAKPAPADVFADRYADL